MQIKGGENRESNGFVKAWRTDGFEGPWTGQFLCTGSKSFLENTLVWTCEVELCSRWWVVGWQRGWVHQVGSVTWFSQGRRSSGVGVACVGQCVVNWGWWCVVGWSLLVFCRRLLLLYSSSDQGWYERARSGKARKIRPQVHTTRTGQRICLANVGCSTVTRSPRGLQIE